MARVTIKQLEKLAEENDLTVRYEKAFSKPYCVFMGVIVTKKLKSSMSFTIEKKLNDLTLPQWKKEITRQLSAGKNKKRLTENPPI
ncbi:MAG: hypothetical protein KUG82_18065 [Pseudomonadales bacterium]|nr:hypothetical protein [Pseudomonadales bacterium]